jgi:hypothetical protein
MKNLKLAWEKVGNERVAVHQIPTKRHPITPGQLQTLTMAKMMDVTIIRGDFFDDSIAFYPCVCLMLESKERLEFIGTYRANLSHYTDPESPDFTNDLEKIGKLPSVCIRRGIWHKRTNSIIIREFQTAHSKKDYILSDVQTEISVAFIRLKDFPVLESLIADSTKLIKDGINFQRSPEVRTPYYNIYLTASDEHINLDLLYEPNCVVSSSLDDLTGRWQSYLIDSPIEESIMPDKDFDITYKYSIFDRISRLELFDEP